MPFIADANPTPSAESSSGRHTCKDVVYSLSELPKPVLREPSDSTKKARCCRGGSGAYYWTGVIFALFSLVTMNYAMPSGDKPRWVNPCDLPGHTFDASIDMDGAPAIGDSELFSNVKIKARVAREHSSHIKDKFLKTYFNDPDFIRGTAVHRQSWLPKIPLPTEEDFRNINKKEAFLKSYEFLQYFAVGIEQIIMDQVIHDGEFLDEFREIENILTQVLCELQLGLYTFQVHPSRDVLRDVMSQKYRDVAHSLRNIRDYLILRDYVAVTDFIAELFAHLERTL